MADPISIGVLMAVSAGASVLGGVSAYRESKKEASALEEQGLLEQQESLREAQLHADDVRRFHRTQAVAFTKNGVSLAGSPLLVLDDTVSRGQEEVDSIARSGDAARRLRNQQASKTRNQGRASLIGSIGQAAGTVVSGMSATKSLTPKSQQQVFFNPILGDY